VNLNLTGEQRSILALSLVPDIGPRRFQALTAFFGSAQNACAAGEKDIAAVEGLPRETASRIARQLATVDPEKECRSAADAGVRIITCIDSDYPACLKLIGDYPPVLYVRGRLEPDDEISIAVVGTRHATAYGGNVAEKFSKEIAGHGITVISGLARGIDTYSHQGALSVGGRTVAVLGNGLLKHYPPENKKLEEKIVDSGALVSEFAMNADPDKSHFPRRNRIIAGMALATVVIESDIKSGALITAELALEQGKDVFAVPGPLFSRYSRGPHKLIKSGAQLAESAQDIIDAIAPLAEWLKKKKRATLAPANEIQILDANSRKIVAALDRSHDGVTIDVLAQETGFLPGELAGCLLDLEIKGVIRSLAGNRYVRNY